MNEKQKSILNTLRLKTVIIVKNYSKIEISHYSPTNRKFPREFFARGQKAPWNFTIKTAKNTSIFRKILQLHICLY